jgi:hypothetical protein
MAGSMVVLDDRRGFLVPLRGDADVEEGQDPGHEELREREDVGHVHFADDLLFHQLRPVTDEHGQGEIVEEEENGRGDDELRFAGQQALKGGLGFDLRPVRGARLGTGLVFGKGSFCAGRMAAN